MSKACQLYVKTCHTCTKQKKLQTKQKAALCKYHAGNPMDRVHIDILRPFPVSDNRNRYIPMLVDQFTEWLEAYPLPDQTAVTVARAVVDNFITRFGCPWSFTQTRDEILRVICSKQFVPCWKYPKPGQPRLTHAQMAWLKVITALF